MSDAEFKAAKRAAEIEDARQRAVMSRRLDEQDKRMDQLEEYISEMRSMLGLANRREPTGSGLPFLSGDQRPHA